MPVMSVVTYKTDKVMEIYRNDDTLHETIKDSPDNWTPLERSRVESFLCNATSVTVQYLHYLKSKDAIDPNYMLNQFLKYLPDDYEKYHTYVLEYNFTSGCHMMPWQDKHIRVVYHNTFGPKSHEFIGIETIRPVDVFDETKVIDNNITKLNLRN